MFRYFRFAFFSLTAALILAACETVPETVTMSQAVFDGRMEQAQSTKPPTSAERLYTTLLESDDLTQDMRINALFQRASLRRVHGLNRAGALADFDALLALNPEHHLAANARIERDYVRKDIAAIKARRNSGRLQTIASWFDDAWQLGERELAAKRYQQSGLTPTKRQIRELVAADFICKSGGEGEPVYKYGDPRGDLEGLRWCRAL